MLPLPTSQSVTTATGRSSSTAKTRAIGSPYRAPVICVGSWRVADGRLITIPDALGWTCEATAIHVIGTQVGVDAAERSNSGVKYRLHGGDIISTGPPRFAAGWEYQLADDAGDPGARVDDSQKRGAL